MALRVKRISIDIRQDWVRFLVAGISIALGFYIVTHENYLDNRITHANLVGWLDDKNIGILIIIVGLLMISSVFIRFAFWRLLTLMLNAFVSGAILFVFFVRDLDGAHNMTWIYALFFVLAIFGIALMDTGTAGRNKDEQRKRLDRRDIGVGRNRRHDNRLFSTLWKQNTKQER
ncbi:hypothetical protein ACNAN0_02565 [Agrilactobacillus fermenti]|uniref:hypothetical protein n=1 Tax=Agrilactobacillus fermenti TaxID=2586909 RepID=UPI001E506DE7|nr:hypothetical protein [Agrilactobacillus fermenti]MCD2256401.1 hypothetical protein [Agrilactobacillus fermenti]